MRITLAIAMAATLCASSAVRADSAIKSQLEGWLSAQQTSGAVAASSFAIVSDSKVISGSVGHRNGIDGPAPDADTQFQIGSITKVFTDLLLAEMVAKNAVRFDTQIGELLPKSVQPRNPAVVKITLEALATHHSGLPSLPANLDLSNTVDPYAGYDVDMLREGLISTRDKQPLGSFYAYSNFGVGLLGHLLGQRDGQGYFDAVLTQVVAPLKLQRTTFEPSDNAARAVSGGKPVTAWGFQDSLAGAGALWGSVSDLARLTQAYIGSHPHALQHPLEDDLKIVADAGNYEVTRVWHVARAGDVPVYWHNGGTRGFHSFVGFRTDTAQSVSILVSGDADPTVIGLRALGVQPIKGKAKKVDQSLLGQYPLSPQFAISVLQADGILMAQGTGQPAFGLHSVGDDWFALGEVDASLHFFREDGVVSGIEMVQAGAIHRAPRASSVVAAPSTATEISAETLPDYAGIFELAPGANLTIKATTDGLQVQLIGQPFYPVFAKGDDRFFYKVVEAELQFERDEVGKVVAVVLRQSGIEQRAKRTR